MGGGRNLSSYQAFTLAEVLITLAIVGIVFAIITPILVTNYRKKLVEVRLKNFYSTFMNAFQISQVENGDFSTWNYVGQSVGTDQAFSENDEFFNVYFFKYLKGIRICKPKECADISVDTNVSTGGLNYSRYVLSDGSCFGLLTGGTGNSYVNIHGWYDYNCSGKPNKAGRDQFLFRMRLGSSSMYIPLQFSNEDGNLVKKSRAHLKEHCKEKPADCGALIQFDGWVVSKDYPIKL